MNAVEVKNLSVKFGNFTAVNNISFTVARGEIFGFLGANGAGKTTTIRVLCGLLAPTSGEVKITGIGFDQKKGERIIKSKVGYMSQKFTLYDDMTVEENLNFIASLRKLDSGEYLKRRQELFNFITFDRPLNSKVANLSGGIKQQVSLAASLLHDPDIVFLDEPTAGVTPASRHRFWALIRKIAGQGKTVFVTTHYMDEAEECGRIALMRSGELIALNSPEGLKKEAFQMPMYEFEPKDSTGIAGGKNTSGYTEIYELRHQTELFSFFEPYGLRFHAVIKNKELWEKQKTEFESRFHIREISPTLEDVFIHAVEGRP